MLRILRATKAYLSQNLERAAENDYFGEFYVIVTLV